ncbi:SUMF1/EgtB/PvdO family nonheme iron enzyme [Craterilacuibacter sp. RT1T]|uniref:SUMF1/EgtB/PvdO family nonheme iron enzyme n=1 Tax=Craterilacuibacter sp. RT1T TaxID=2942211 RepID=UPI0020BF4B32|nr:SUMF1/EgtB/PvdO family nonheme iron enzyme [Craterilacuibacter sp. RT1T]MCL6262171.1 formylglycine-generating enzyme family protein [Craterilacuibacter sp. RT1T]
MSIVISVVDSLRQSVEAASGGKNTVLYDSKGYPSIMAVIPKFNVQDIDASLGTGVHPAFVVGGVEKSEIFVGKFQATLHDGNALSLPGMNPARSLNYDAAHTACRNKGAGWHLMTNAEWAALALWCWKNGFMPRGNNNFGRDTVQTYETARRVNGGRPGDATGDGATLTGSGPASWYHDNTMAGVADLNGNVWEWQSGLRLNDGEIQIIANNDAALASADHSAGSADWKAIKVSDGTLVAPGTAGTAKYDSPAAGTTGNHGTPLLSDTIVNRTGTAGDSSNTPGLNSGAFESCGIKAGLTAPALLKQLGLYPVAATGLGGDQLYLRNYGERLPVRGGDWYYAAAAGVFALYCNNPRTTATSSVGFRPAFVA